MTIEATPRTNAFATFQQKLVSAGIRVGSPAMTGLQEAAQTYAAAVADEAVAGATLCLTEHDIAHAISMWADEETAQGQMARAVQLRQASVAVLRVAKDVDEERAKAVLRLPPAAPELPKWIRDRIDSVLCLVYGEKAEPAPIHRLFATVVHEMVRTALGQAPSDVNAPQGMVPTPAQQPQARDERTGKPLVMSHLVASARQSPAHAVAAAMEALRNAGATELAATVEARLALVPALQPRTAAEARQIREGGPQIEAHNFPGTPGGTPVAVKGAGLEHFPPVYAAGSKMVQTMIPEGGVHLPTWERAVHACADRLREDGHARLALALVDDVKPPKAG